MDFKGNMLRAVIYIRVSREENVRDVHFSSLDSQRLSLENYAAANGIDIVGIYEEKMSAKDNNRPEFIKMKKRIEEGDIQILLACRADRISRDVIAYQETLNFLRAYNVREIYTNDMNVDCSNPDGRFVRTLTIATASLEREKTSSRLKSKFENATKEGYYVVGLPPVGYVRGSVDPKILEIDSRASAHIEYIFNEFAAGKTASEVSKSTMALGWRTPIKSNKKRKLGGSYYTENLVSRILRNPVYAGYVYRTNDSGEIEIYEGKHIGIISRDIWDKVQSKLVSKKLGETTILRNRKVYPLKKKLFCSCGHQMTAVPASKKRKNGSGYCYYVCTRKRCERSECTCNTSISQVVIESVLFSAFAYLGSSNASATFIKAEQAIYQEGLSEEYAKIKKELKKKQKVLSNATESMFVAKHDTPLGRSIIANMQNLSEEISQLEERISELDKQLSLLKSKVDFSKLQTDATINNLDILNDNLSPEEKMSVIERVASKITLHVDSVANNCKYYSMTIMPTVEYEQTLGVQVITFSYNNTNSSWKVSSPFSLESGSSNKLSPKPKGGKKQQRHFLHKHLKLLQSYQKSPLTQLEFAEKAGIGRTMLCRIFGVLNRLSENAIAFVLSLRYKADADKVTFNKLERISKLHTSQQLQKLKMLLK